jgi:hypothetical protein
MYALILVIAIRSLATDAVTPVGVTSQSIGTFVTLDQCKVAAMKPLVGGAISDLSLSRGVYWYCAFIGEKASRANMRR